MERDAHGNFMRLIDRKKEIYKNVKGETIAPQRIENLFRDLESVGRAFLVGDHREFNTLLIYPNPESRDIDLASLPTGELRDHFRSLVVSVNKFLAPYERIVDFALIDRDLDAEQGELTEKGTPRRKTVTKNFNDQIRALYRRIHLHVGGVEVILPNWLLQALGMTAQDLTVDGDLLRRTGAEPLLSIEALDEEVSRVGDVVYGHAPGPLDLGALLSAPRLWLGNGPLVDFLPLESTERQRPGRTASGIRWVTRRESTATAETERAELATLGDDEAWRLERLDAAVRLLASSDESIALEALERIAARVGSDENRLAGPARWALARVASHGTLELRKRALVQLVTLERDSRFDEMLRRFLDGDGIVLDDGTRQAIARSTLTTAKIDAWIGATQRACLAAHDETSRAFSLLQLLAEYGSAHPTSYRTLRAALVRMQLIAPNETVRLAAREAAMTLRDGFRRWLGPSFLVAVDPETGEEYAWSDVVAFDDSVPVADRDRLMVALRETTLLREALFLFSKGIVIQLSDIPRGGVWVRMLGQRHGKAVHRITVHTRHQGSHDLAVNVNHELTEKQVYEEIHWLILSGGTASRDPLVEDFGGYWQQTDLWSEEFVPGDTLARGLKRMARDRDPGRLAKTWPFLAWTALSAYVDFWNRSGKRWEIADPSMTNVVVPMDDFKHGVRIVSVTARQHHSGLLGMIRSFRDEFIKPAETQYPVLKDLVGWDIIFSSILEVSGEEEGNNLLQKLLDRKQESLDNELRSALESYLAAIRARGFRPRRLYFAVERYGRWRELGDDPTREARARTLRELYDTYNLAELDREYPWTRVRFFLDTVFCDSNETLREGLETLVSQIRHKLLVGDERVDAIAELRAKLKHGEDDDYFLARLSYPYLLPEDAAAFVSGTLAGNQQSEMVVTLEDNDGRPFQVRHALSPKEVGYLHRLFLAAKLDVRFRAEHRYLVAIGERGQLIGGIFYELEEESAAHLEKIVVMERFRRKGVADGLMKQLFNRLASIGIKTVTTGFFRPEYFYSYGFTIEKHYAGLVKALKSEDDESEKA